VNVINAAKNAYRLELKAIQTQFSQIFLAVLCCYKFGIDVIFRAPKITTNKMKNGVCLSFLFET
jgi:hypothetical protein